MGIDLRNRNGILYGLTAHKGHEVKIVSYGTEDTDVNLALECETCGVVLIDVDTDEGVQLKLDAAEMNHLDRVTLERTLRDLCELADQSRNVGGGKASEALRQTIQELGKLVYNKDLAKIDKETEGSWDGYVDLEDYCCIVIKATDGNGRMIMADVQQVDGIIRAAKAFTGADG